MKYKDYLTERKQSTDFYETAAAIGVVCSDALGKKCTDIIYNYKNTKIEVIKEALDKIKATLGGNYDWVSKGAAVIKKLTVEKDTTEVIDLMAILAGMYSFRKEIVEMDTSGPLQFIHNKIGEYYKVEKEVLGSIKGAKANTADIIVGNASPSKIFDTMRKGPITTDEAEHYIDLGSGVNIYQCSLKKREAEAQIGKITKFIKKNLGYGVETGAAVKILSHNYIDILDKILLNEGIWDKAKHFAKNLWNKVSAAVKKVMSGYISKWIGFFKKSPPDAYIKDFMIGLGNPQLQEAMTELTAGQVESIAKNPSKAIKLINNEIKRLQNTVMKDKTVYLNISLLSPMKKFKGDAKKAAFTLVSNYCTVRALIDMVADERTTGEVVNRLVAEMLFGSTKLPLWKVFGDYGDGNSYMHLGSMEAWLTGSKAKSDVEVLGIRISPLKDFYVIMVGMLEDIKEDGKKYVLLRTGTNSSSRFTFIFEGIKTFHVPLEDSIATVVNKKR